MTGAELVDRRVRLAAVHVHSTVMQCSEPERWGMRTTTHHSPLAPPGPPPGPPRSPPHWHSTMRRESTMHNTEWRLCVPMIAVHCASGLSPVDSNVRRVWMRRCRCLLVRLSGCQLQHLLGIQQHPGFQRGQGCELGLYARVCVILVLQPRLHHAAVLLALH